MSEGIGQFIPIMKMPKLITFALPSVETIESDGEVEVKKLEKLLPKARDPIDSEWCHRWHVCY